MIKNSTIEIPHFIRKGVSHSSKGAPKHFLILAGDVETNLKGEPILLLLQAYKDNPICLDVDKCNIQDKFIDWLYKNSFESKIGVNATNVIFFHNLLFDLSAIFIEHHERFGSKEFVISGKTNEYSYLIDIKCHKTVFGKITFYSKKNEIIYVDDFDRYKPTKIVYLRDSFQFYNYSLKKVARDLKLKENKADRPKLMGKIKDRLYDENPKHVKEFIEYSLQDVKTQLCLAEHIIDTHLKEDINLCVSLAQISARVFKHNFLKEDDCLTFPHPKGREIAQYSYHGGKNGFYLKQPELIPDVYEIDVNSMYPHAMMEMPNFNQCDYYNSDDYEKNLDGVYKISGFVHDSKYKIIPKHEFGQKENYYNDTYIEDVCITSYELRQALKDKLIELDSIEGILVIEDKTASNPIQDYVKYFYEKKKNTPKEDSNYLYYKLMLNSLYGKFQQLTELYTESARKDILQSFGFIPHGVDYINDGIASRPETFWKAGGLYNPMVSTLITGFARTYLYQLETKYEAFDSSTDSVKTVVRPKGCNKELGGFDVKHFGDCLFIRNKLYLHFDEDYNISSYALHGFQGSPKQLYELWKTKTNIYSHLHMNKVKESLISGKTPLIMEEREKRLDIKW